MDYCTKPISRSKLRMIAGFIRKLFKSKNKYFFDVVKVFELLPHYFDNVFTEIVSDDDQELNGVPAATILLENRRYCIKVKESVYEKAYFEKNGGYRMHIMHEISHYLLFMLGYTPQFDRVYKNKELKSYESVEWQAKALAGEILIPYENTIDMSTMSIMRKCKVSREAALNRKKIG